VIQYLSEQHPERLQQILDTLRRRVPRLEKVKSTIMPDGRLLLQIKDAPFEEPILAKFASDGTLKMLSYLTVLYDPDPPPLIGIEEPENHLHPRLLPELAEECRAAAAHSQLMVTTHSPFFVNGLRPAELWVLYRDDHGFTRARRAVDMPLITQMMDEGAQLGHLWTEGFFDVGDPLGGTTVLRHMAP
jgi:predicted ATPase